MDHVDELIAVRYASKRVRRSDLYARFSSYREEDAEQVLDYYFWILRRGDSAIVVDTGFALDAGRRRGATPGCPPEEALRRLGIDPAAVATVVLTHLHYDHIGNLGLYANATVLAPAAELEFWRRPLARRPLFAEHVEAAELALVESLREAGRVHPYAGPQALAPGLEAIALPGHAPGLHGLLVATAAGPVLLCSDAVHLYAELEGDRLFSVVADAAAMYESFDRVRGLREEGALLVPSHDPEVARRFPAVSEELREVAFRIA